MPQLLDTRLFQDANLKAYYKLSDVNDSTANAFNLTNTNSVGFVSGNFGNCADYGASNTNKTLHITNDLGIQGGVMSYSIWVKLQAQIASGSWDFIDHEDAGTNTQERIRYDYNAGTIRLRFTRGKSGVANNDADYTITLGTTSWYHLALTFDAATVVGYVNGVQVTSIASSGNGTSGSIDNFSIGSDARGTSNFSSIYADDAAVFNKALTAAEVWILYTTQMQFNNFQFAKSVSAGIMSGSERIR